MRTLLPLLLAGTALFAGEIPQGKMPRIDGAWGEGEWADAHVVKLAGGEARVFTAGRALCLGIRIEAPYAGERIDLYVATRSGATGRVVFASAAGGGSVDVCAGGGESSSMVTPEERMTRRTRPATGKVSSESAKAS